ncbi:MAG: hypothetical protein K0R62_7707 [Nonomuraea muscovyensis]|nr:hypothetical protein [Nonomuraea muscovyensis]
MNAVVDTGRTVEAGHNPREGRSGGAVAKRRPAPTRARPNQCDIAVSHRTTGGRRLDASGLDMVPHSTDAARRSSTAFTATFTMTFTATFTMTFTATRSPHRSTGRRSGEHREALSRIAGKAWAAHRMIDPSPP